jgi:hypothetical protein
MYNLAIPVFAFACFRLGMSGEAKRPRRVLCVPLWFHRHGEIAQTRAQSHFPETRHHLL